MVVGDATVDHATLRFKSMCRITKNKKLTNALSKQSQEVPRRRNEKDEARQHVVGAMQQDTERH